ncbi:LlaMI family restriction endonuclease [Clostridium sp. YIM B02569]|uniref:LlaMI family restriction endonuclease n=1 Tax=Clostridium sp. YIM B02569 TaxID=2911967 RepID=UPI001EEB3776|nr:LlaMI family restriction endonuclease [Clostridium sp. YIM B02569]
MNAKERIIELFNSNVRGRTPDVSGRNQRHDGRYGHWLERQFGITANGYNAPDLYGYELKNETSSKITFGDWSADYYVYKNDIFSHIFSANTAVAKRDIFLSIFGQNVTGRYSWSGSPCPCIHGYNRFGQILIVAPDGNVIALYNYNEDRRPNKSNIIPQDFKVENLILAEWRKESLKRKVEDKFNQNGWFTCKTDNTGAYYQICFGAPMSYENWLELVRRGIVIFDSGMHEGNPRPYSMWRANNNYWESLIVERY